MGAAVTAYLVLDPRSRCNFIQLAPTFPKREAPLPEATLGPQSRAWDVLFRVFAVLFVAGLVGLASWGIGAFLALQALT